YEDGCVLMFWAQVLGDAGGGEFPMGGVLPKKSFMGDRIAALVSFEVGGADGNDLLPPRQSIRGHQFRYSDLGPVPLTVKRQYRVRGVGTSESTFPEGYRIGNCLASYIHLHFLSNIGFAARWLDLCRRSDIRT